MGLTDVVRSALDSGFVALDDFVEDVTYSRKPVPAYDVVQDEVNEATPTQVAVGMVFVDFTDTERRENAGIDMRDVKGIVTGTAFVAADILPEHGDSVLRGDVRYYVEMVWQQPGRAAWELQLRRQVPE